MDEVIRIIETACLKHSDSGEASVTKEARVIIEALKNAGYEISKPPIHYVVHLRFAEWIDIYGIRNGKEEWKWKGDNYAKIYSTEEMFLIYQLNKPVN